MPLILNMVLKFQNTFDRVDSFFFTNPSAIKMALPQWFCAQMYRIMPNLIYSHIHRDRYASPFLQIALLMLTLFEAVFLMLFQQPKSQLCHILVSLSYVRCMLLQKCFYLMNFSLSNLKKSRFSKIHYKSENLLLDLASTCLSSD